jgi:hypothetical protein
MWLILGTAATAVFWLLVFDLLERRKSRVREKSGRTRLH